MTLREKTTIQRKQIRSFLKTLKTTKPSKDILAGNFLREMIRQLCITEIEYYGYKCGRLSGNDVVLDLFYIDDENKTGDFLISYHLDAFENLVLELPRIRVNFGGQYLRDVFSDDANKRVTGGKEVLDTLFHEIKHFRQFMMKRSGYSSKQNLLFSKESIVADSISGVYKINHDRFSQEADANHYEFVTRGELGTDRRLDLTSPDISNSDREFACFMVPYEGYVERDSYLHSKVSEIMESKKLALTYWKLWPVIQKEFNSELTRICFSDMISNYKSEIEEALQTISDSKQRNTIIKDIREMYYEMFNRTLLLDNRFEIYEAIKYHGISLVKEILTSMKHYNSREKRRKIDLIKKKQETFTSILNSGNYIRPNYGLIIDPRRYNGDCIEVDEYVNTLIRRLDGLNNDMHDFILSKEFLGNIPLFGYYVLNSGKKLSIYEFLQDYLIPGLSNHHKEDYMNVYMDIVMRFTKPHCDVESQYHIEVVNKDFQKKNNAINECLDLPILKESKLSEFESLYSDELLKDMRTVLDICNGNNTVFRQFRATEIYLSGSTYKVLNQDQIAYLDRLVSAAICLSGDEILNPLGYNYEHKLKSTTEFSKIKSYMERYKQANRNRLMIL